MSISDVVISKIGDNKVLKKAYYQYQKVFPTYVHYIKQELGTCRSYLDLGCGPNSPSAGLSSDAYSVGVDLFKKYILLSKVQKLHNDYIMGDLRTIEIKDSSFDCVISIDVLEHLSKQDGRKLVEKMEKIARKKVIIFTVNGFIPQKELDGNLLQIHKSGWTEGELKELGYKVMGINGLNVLRGELAESKFRSRVIGDFISDITQKLTLHLPVYAFQLLCVKDL